MSRPKVVVVGSYGVGLTMVTPRMPEAGETVGTGHLTWAHGGKGSNQAVGAARLGAQVRLLTAVGYDDFGHSARSLWQNESVDASAVVTIDGSTMAGIIIVQPDGENRIIIAPGVLDELTPEHVERFRPCITDSDMLVVSLELPAAVAWAALQIAHEVGVPALLNPAPVPEGAVPAAVWPGVQVVTPNESEARCLVGAQSDVPALDVAARLQHATGASVVMTLGKNGCIVAEATDNLVHVAAAQATTVLDTTGAGDSFTAALAVRLAEGASLVDSVHFAVRAGAHTVSIPEVVPALPYWYELQD